MRRSPTFFAATVALGVLAVACGDGSPSACAELREPQDPQSGLHVIDPDGLTYTTDPPTSGPHASGPPASGVFDGPLLQVMQVRILESGGAIIQYDETVSAEAVTELTGFVNDSVALDGPVALAPAGSALPGPIVATAWTWKLTCDVVDLERIETFIAERPQDAPGVD
ncbi:MAG: DUF3105 domain-containing protein [Actinobacteria bacterium]|nr:DUF3105 domain-containing protein [Actinomycetota bacterium]